MFELNWCGRGDTNQDYLWLIRFPAVIKRYSQFDIALDGGYFVLWARFLEWKEREGKGRERECSYA